MAPVLYGCGSTDEFGRRMRGDIYMSLPVENGSDNNDDDEEVEVEYTQ